MNNDEAAKAFQKQADKYRRKSEECSQLKKENAKLKEQLEHWKFREQGEDQIDDSLNNLK